MNAQSLGTLELTILLAVVRLDEGAHGLAIRADVSERTGHDYSVGAVYTTLQRLETKGLLSSWSSDPLPVRGGRSRRHFKVTPGGRRAIHNAQRLATSVWADLANPLRPRPA